MMEFFANYFMDKAKEKAAEEIVGTITKEDKQRERLFNTANQYSANASLPQIQNSADLMAGTNSMAGVDNEAAINLSSTMPSLQMGGALSMPSPSNTGMGGVLSEPTQTEEQKRIADSYNNAPTQPSPNDFSGQSFNSAFGDARKSGLDTFKWNGNLYNTQTK
jgi:hypothetical protein